METEPNFIKSSQDYFWRVVEAGATSELSKAGLPTDSVGDIVNQVLAEVRQMPNVPQQEQIASTTVESYRKVAGAIQHKLEGIGAYFDDEMLRFAGNHRLLSVVNYLNAFEMYRETGRQEQYGNAKRYLGHLNEDINVGGVTLVGVDIKKQVDYWRKELGEAEQQQAEAKRTAKATAKTKKEQAKATAKASKGPSFLSKAAAFVRRKH